jgi:hypothetical protein
MARMNTGAAVQNFSELSSIDYSRLPETERLGRERLYQAEQVRGDRVRADAQLPALKELQANNLLKASTEGAISGILQSNPELMQTLDSGTDSEQVNKAYKKFVQGNSGLADNAILSQFLTQADTGMKEAQALQFQQNQDQMAKATSFANAEARKMSAENEANKPKPFTIPSELVSEYQAKNPNAKFVPRDDGRVAVTSFGGLSGGGVDNKMSEWMSNEEILKLQQDTGLTYVQYPGKDPSGSGQDGAYLGRSLAPDEQPILMDFEQDTAKGFQEDARAWVSDGSLPRQTALSNLSVYDEAITALESGAVITGTLSEKLNGILEVVGQDDTIRAFFNPDGQNQLDNIRGVVFQGLRETLGAQFTEKEGLRLVAATYNTKLSPQQNARRLKRLSQLLKDSIEYKDKLSELSLTRDGVISLVTQGGPRTKNWLNSQIDIMEQEFRQADGLAGVGEEPTDPNYKPPLVISPEAKRLVDLYSTKN